MSGAITPTKEAVIAIGEAAPEDREQMVANLRTPRKLTDEEKAKRKEVRKMHEDIERLYQTHIARLSDFRPPETAEQALHPMFLDMENHLETYDMVLGLHPDILTDEHHRAQLLRYFSVVEDYINRIKENRYQPYTRQKPHVLETNGDGQ